jgi:hypothetical protein
MSWMKKIRDYMLQKSRNIAYRPLDYPGFEKLKSMALVFESGKQDETILSFAKQMKAAGKEVELLGYIPRKRKEIQSPPEFNHFTKTEVNWYGKPKSGDVKQFLEGTYQVFITLNEREESPIQFVTVAAKADFVVGLSNGKVARIDLLVGSGENYDYNAVFKEVEYYLKFING